MKFVEASKDRPFFLYYASPLPHVPLFARKELQGSTPSGDYGDAIAEIDTVAPGFCAFLTACQGERFVLLPREDAVARSYTAAGMMASAILAAISGRDLDALAD